MADHKETCPKKTNATATCNCGAETPPPATRTCWDCGKEIGANEKVCPGCKADPKLADEEDGVVERALKRLKAKNKAKPPQPPAPGPGPAPQKKHVFSGLTKLLNKD